MDRISQLGAKVLFSGLVVPVLLLSCLFLPGQCLAETSVWQISNSKTSLYLGGIIHMLSKSDFPLPDAFQRAFNNSDILVLETNIDETKTESFQNKIAKNMVYVNGKTLKDVIDQQTFLKLQTFLNKRGIAVENVIKLKPSMVSIMLSVIEIKRIGMTEQGVDNYFFSMAKNKGMRIKFLETIDEQLSFLFAMGKGNENELISKTLRDLEQLEVTMRQIKLAWRQGNEKELANITIKEMLSEYPALYNDLLVKRNNNWLPNIEKMLQSEETEIILVGALHLLGNKGLLQQLRNKGYKIKQL